MLLGAELYYDLLIQEQIKLGPELPILQNTTLGWIISGRLRRSKRNQLQAQRACHLATVQLPQLIERFWAMEEVGIESMLTKSEQQCENHFEETHSRDADGKFVVRLPRKTPVNKLGDSSQAAAKRLRHMENRMSANPELRENYRSFMEEYENLNHMSEVSNINDAEAHYYLPHHAVIKESSETTRLRVVFDGSSKTSNGYSLNDTLLIGPKLHSELINIIIRFRQHTFVLAADIEKMYRMIWVHPDDRSLQRIFWRKDPSDTMKTYELNTVTYGLGCSPYLAIRCLRQLAYDNEISFPEESTIIKNDFYVDDMLTGHDDLKKLQTLKDNIVSILSSAGFNLRKWKSNHDGLRTDSDNTNLMFDTNEITQMLGVSWNSREDYLTYTVRGEQERAYTKRQILSQISKLFDPLGLVAPVILQAKKLIQELWTQKSDWDDHLSESILHRWNVFKQELHCLSTLRIPRHSLMPNYHDLEIHVFSDASETGYGAVVYLRSSVDNHIQVSLLTSKCKVAPLQRITLPRLELSAAVLAVRLYKLVVQSLTSKIDSTTFWSDSTIVLQWIQKEPSQLQTFVGNRVAEIQAHTETSSWRHISTHDNPADVVSRGKNPIQLVSSDIWWQGPWFLRQDKTQWPNPEFSIDPEFSLECKKTALPVIQTIEDTKEKCTIFRVFSSWNKMVRSTACYLRLIQLLHEKKRDFEPVLTAEELKNAEMTIIRLLQQDAFSQDLSDLRAGNHVKRKSLLKTLNPFFDEELGVIRIGGRLRKSSTITPDQKHPIVLPAHHFITKLILREYHERFGHCGSEQLLAAVRLKYWPIHGKSTAKQTCRSCIECVRFQPRIPQYTMADLPQVRVEQKRPFSSTGVDYAGPFTLRESRRRGRPHTFKAYVAVFVCLKTKAVHLELVTSLTTEAYIAALRRFISRRGLCSELYSDRGTNFIGAFNELRDFYNFLKENSDSIQRNLARMQIKWTFIPPRAPHFGGIWEAAVKSFKRHFYRMTRKLTLTFEECYTLLTQIEAILNSRPLVVLSSDANNLSYLSPSHFLIGDYLMEPATVTYSETPDNRLSTYEHIQKVKEHFWSRWHRDYLQSLQQRTKWQQGDDSLCVDDIVLMIGRQYSTTSLAAGSRPQNVSRN